MHVTDIKIPEYRGKYLEVPIRTTVSKPGWDITERVIFERQYSHYKSDGELYQYTNDKLVKHVRRYSRPSYIDGETNTFRYCECKACLEEHGDSHKDTSYEEIIWEENNGSTKS